MSNNLTAFAEGCDARTRDEETGELSDNPYTSGTLAFTDWYRGYNFKTEEESQPTRPTAK